MSTRPEASSARSRLADQLAYLASDLAGLGQQREVVAQLLSYRPAEFTCPGRIVFVCLAHAAHTSGEGESGDRLGRFGLKVA